MNKRKKHVFDTGKIPRLHHTQDEARNRQSNLYFIGRHHLQLQLAFSHRSSCNERCRQTGRAFPRPNLRPHRRLAPCRVQQLHRAFVSSMSRMYATDGTAEAN